MSVQPTILDSSFDACPVGARLHTGELKIAAMPDAGALQEELKDFQRKVSDAGRATYNAGLCATTT